MNGNKDIKPMRWAKKSKIAERADMLEARAEAKKEAEAQAKHVHIIIEHCVNENGEIRPATPEEKAEFESWAK